MSSSEKPPVIGIDLGTVYSSVGVWDPSLGRVRIIADEYGNTQIPSCVAFTETQRVIGTAAYDVNQISSNLGNTIFGTKRLIGRKFNEPSIGEDMKQWPFNVKEKRDMPVVSVNYKNQWKQFCCQEISAMIVSKLHQLAEDDLGCCVEEAVISVPAFFTDSQRQAMIDAGAIAGLNVLQIVNEGTASAINYAVERRVSRKKRILVFDLGAGSVDVSIAVLEKGLCEIIHSTAGDTCLGGMDFDNRIVDYCVEKIKKKLKRDISGNKGALMMLRRGCERAKIELSSKENASIHLEYDGIDFKTELYRTIFDELCTNLIKKCMELVNRCLKAEGLVSSDVDEVVLVGGCAQIPAVQQRLRSCLDGKVLVEVESNETVAAGSAYLGASLSGVFNDLVCRDIANLSFSCEYRVTGLSPNSLKSKIANKKRVLISKNTPIPSKNCQINVPIVRSVLMPNDRKIVLKIYEGDNNVLGEIEGGKVENTYKLLGKFELSTKGSDLVTVIFKADTNGILNVSAQGNEDSYIPITSDIGRLTTIEISKMTSEAAIYKSEDEEIWKKVKSINICRNVIQGTDITETPKNVTETETLEEVTETETLEEITETETFEEVTETEILEAETETLEEVTETLEEVTETETLEEITETETFEEVTETEILEEVTETETLEEVSETLEEIPDTLKKVTDTFKDILASDTSKNISNALKQIWLYLLGTSIGERICFGVILILISYY
ncbi:heat shock 70 kDa protein 18-like [Rosa rugosa]|uniref:heat shock 70 kDa protein 18-like n=1 Tax=Rosa rugosa TaxID=74645 RepID=UPI002B4168A3|nr:heat shock 70 kDa protein 18-like [Rosa rugosa]